MNKAVIATITFLLLFGLIACESKTTGKRVAIPDTGITASVVKEIETPSAPTGETGKTAAETLKELQSGGSAPIASGEKSGTFYPPITSDATGKDALKEKTRALFGRQIYDPNVEADDEFGPRYHDNDGDLTNLPDDYSDNNGD